MPTPTKKDSEQRNPSRTTKILETVEQLLAMQERRDVPGRRQSDELSQRLQSVEKKIGDLATQLPSEGCSRNQIQDLLSQLERRLSGELKKSANSTSAAASREKGLATGDRDRLVSALEKRFSVKLEQLEATLLDQLQPADPTTDDASPSILQSLEFLRQQMQEQTRLLIEAIEKQSVAVSSPADDSAPTDEPGDFQQSEDWQTPGVSASGDSSASHWHRQKEAMLAKYGIDPNYRPVDVVAPTGTATMVLDEIPDKAVEKLEELHQSIDRISQEDSEAIEELKQELNAKLREAEIELSINRARLSQQKAELEQQKAELKHRTADLEAKLAANKHTRVTKKVGLVGRLSRYLGGK